MLNMRASWKRLVIVVIYVFFLWIIFNMFLVYWKNRRPSMSHSTEALVSRLKPGVRVLPLRKKVLLNDRETATLEPNHRGWFKSEVFKNLANAYEGSKSVQCDGHFIGYQNQFASLGPVVINGKLARGRKGGEDISSVLNQPEHREFLNFAPGFFQLLCNSAEQVQYNFRLGHRNHLNSYLNSLTCAKALDSTTQKLEPNTTVFVVTRYEYVNIYHSMTDFYNAFLNMAFLGLRPENIVILFADAHPKGGLDDIWSTLFHSFRRVGELRNSEVLVNNMVWVQLSYLSPLITHKLSAIPATEEFRHFFLSRYKVKDIDRPLKCSNIRVTFIWRRDYLAHPRNPSGHVVRKIKNEAELVAEIRHEIPHAKVQGVQIDVLPMREQLQLVVDSDILVGMHGAGLTHALFLPKHAGLVEMYPTYWSEGNVHFKKIAQWRSLHYQRWVNHNPRLELANHFTRIPPGVVSSMVRQVLHGMHCAEHQH